MKKVYSTRECYDSNTNCDLTFIRFPDSSQRAQLWAEGLGICISKEHARNLQKQYVCSKHFSETDFTSAERSCLGIWAVLNRCTVILISHPHFASSHEEPTLIQMKTPPFPFDSANEIAFDGELGSINIQSTSPKNKAQHSLLEELGVDRVVKLTPKKKKLYDRTWTREGVL